MDYPFKKIHSREFGSLDLITLVSTFNSMIDNQNANNNYSNDNRICDTNPMIDSDGDTQSQDGGIEQQSKEKI